MTEGVNPVDPNLLLNTFPHFLTSGQKEDLWEWLNDFPNNPSKNFYTSDPRFRSQVWQGDVFNGLSVYNFRLEDRKTVRGCILSNTCDISPENSRDMPLKFTFAPVVKLNKYLTLIEKQSGLSPGQIEDKARAIRSQRITNLFYFPEYSDHLNESIMLFDDIHSIEPELFESMTKDTEKIVTLNMYGHFMLLNKLSIHFTRFSEGISRPG